MDGDNVRRVRDIGEVGEERCEEESEEGGSAFDGNREIQKRRRTGRLELALHGFVDNLLHVRAAPAAAKAGTGCACHVPSRGCALSDETANLAISDSAAMANEHRMDHSWRS